MRRTLAPLCLATVLLGATVARKAAAEAPSPELMAKLAAHADRFERMRSSASYSIVGRMEQVDGEGKASTTKEMVARVEPNGLFPQFIVDRYLEDGEDKTDEAREEANERAEARKRDPAKYKKKEIRIPTLASEQPRYVFDVVEVDKTVPSRVKLSFTPRERDERTIEGTAWIDTAQGTVLSAGFKLARTSMFVNFVHVKVVFGENTPLGPAVSKVEFEGEGGLLFIRKHVRGSATLSRYRVTP